MAVAVMESMASLTERALAEQASAALSADDESQDTLSLRGIELDASSKHLSAAPSRRLSRESSKMSVQSAKSARSVRSVQSKLSNKSGLSKPSKPERVPGLQPSFPALLAPRGTLAAVTKKGLRETVLPPDLDLLLSESSHQWNVRGSGCRHGFLSIKASRAVLKRAHAVLVGRCETDEKQQLCGQASCYDRWILCHVVILEGLLNVRLVYGAPHAYSHSLTLKVVDAPLLEVRLSGAALSFIPKVIFGDDGVFALSSSGAHFYAAAFGEGRDARLPFWLRAIQHGGGVSCARSRSRAAVSPALETKCLFCGGGKGPWMPRPRLLALPPLEVYRSEVACDGCFRRNESSLRVERLTALDETDSTTQYLTNIRTYTLCADRPYESCQPTPCATQFNWRPAASAPPQTERRLSDASQVKLAAATRRKSLELALAIADAGGDARAADAARHAVDADARLADAAQAEIRALAREEPVREPAPRRDSAFKLCGRAAADARRRATVSSDGRTREAYDALALDLSRAGRGSAAAAETAHMALEAALHTATTVALEAEFGERTGIEALVADPEDDAASVGLLAVRYAAEAVRCGVAPRAAGDTRRWRNFAAASRAAAAEMRVDFFLGYFFDDISADEVHRLLRRAAEPLVQAHNDRVGKAIVARDAKHAKKRVDKAVAAAKAAAAHATAEVAKAHASANAALRRKRKEMPAKAIKVKAAARAVEHIAEAPVPPATHAAEEEPYVEAPAPSRGADDQSGSDDGAPPSVEADAARGPDDVASPAADDHEERSDDSSDDDDAGNEDDGDAEGSDASSDSATEGAGSGAGNTASASGDEAGSGDGDDDDDGGDSNDGSDADGSDEEESDDDDATD
ncbi:hypothetical protein M885DRAFT_615332 [Pelagophyceae sp. CCMP2097]|nr:hypothetical protein M885DRAFT_615332 [Pelagophyceae sp. CCMP2097]